MDFTRDEVQTELGELARRIFDTRVTPDFLRAHASAGTPFDAVLWDQLHEAGLVTAALPTEAGGLGFGMLELGWILEAAGRVLAPVPLLCTALAARALARALARAATGATTGTGNTAAEQAKIWLMAIASRHAVVALALTDASDDPLAPAVQATPLDGSGKGWRLDGTKTVVAYGASAEALLVTAHTADASALFVVPGNSPGLELHAQRSTHGEPWALLELRNVCVEAGACLGGSEAVARLIDETRAAAAAWQVGLTEAAVRQTATYVSSRHQFGRPLGSMQAVQQRLADAYIDVEAMRSTSLLAAGLLDQSLPGNALTADVAVAAYWAARGGHRVTHATQHLHGGMGADIEYPIHRYFLNAKATGLGLGGAQALLSRIGTEIAAGRIRRLSGVET